MLHTQVVGGQDDTAVELHTHDRRTSHSWRGGMCFRTRALEI
jgi:hypothetical protein